MVVDSCKFFDAMTAKYTLKPTGKRKYHRNSTMSKAEVMLIIILFHDSGYRCFIETVNDELKNISQVEHSIHRYFDRFIINLLQAITTYFQRSVHQCTKHHLHSPYIVLNPSNSRYIISLKYPFYPVESHSQTLNSWLVGRVCGIHALISSFLSIFLQQ